MNRKKQTMKRIINTNVRKRLNGCIILKSFLNWKAVVIPEEDLPPEIQNSKKKFIYLISIVPVFTSSDITNEPESDAKFTERKVGEIIEEDGNEIEFMINMKRRNGDNIKSWWKATCNYYPTSIA